MLGRGDFVSMTGTFICPGPCHSCPSDLPSFLKAPLVPLVLSDYGPADSFEAYSSSIDGFRFIVSKLMPAATISQGKRMGAVSLAFALALLFKGSVYWELEVPPSLLPTPPTHRLD